MTLPDLTIRPYRPGDEVGILATFNRVFREVCGEGYVDRTLAQWLWQYIDNPAGYRMSLAAAPDGTIAEIAGADGSVTPLPRFTTTPPTRSTTGNLDALPLYAGTSIDAGIPVGNVRASQNPATPASATTTPSRGAAPDRCRAARAGLSGEDSDS